MRMFAWIIGLIASFGGAGMTHCAVVPSGNGSVAGYEIPRENFKFSFPRDHGGHPGFKLEWWYVTGHLWAGERRYGFQATFFRSALHPPPAQDSGSNYFGRDHLYLAHMALVDVTKGTYSAEERLNRNGWDAGAARTDVDVHNGNWRLTRTPSDTAREALKLQGTVLGGVTLELDLTPRKPLVIFGQNGLSRKGADPTAASYYLTYPRLDVQGQLTLDGRADSVKGEAWMDHEISSSQLSTNQVGWDWASLQLRDGREIMLYLMRTKSGGIDPYSTLAWVDETGRLTQIGPSQFSWRVLRTWRSPHTGGNYPVEVELETIDPKTKQRVSLRLKPVLDDQELVGKVAGISYWEGACDVLDGNGRRTGVAYLELTGYAGDLAGKMGK